MKSVTSQILLCNIEYKEREIKTLDIYESSVACAVPGAVPGALPSPRARSSLHTQQRS